MSYPFKKAVNYNGETLFMDTFDSCYVENREIYIIGAITDELAAIVNSALLGLYRVSKEDITLYIQSPGGSVSAGLSIFDTVKALDCDVVTVACGMAASMGAFLLAAAGTKGKRWCLPNAKILIHQPLGGTSGQATDIRIHTEDILNTRAKLNQILSECTGQPVDKIDRDTERDYIMNAEEALKYGLIDRIGHPISEE